MPGEEALVSIGLTTHNRLDTLERAARSALDQTHRNLELVIADNASTDGTRAWCEELCEREPRVRYIRHPVNRGPVPNFNAVRDACRGDPIMLLADDDWIDPTYVEACLAVLRARDDVALAGGRARYYRGDAFLAEGTPLHLNQSTGARRVIAFYRLAGVDAAYYGLVRRSVIEQLGPMRNVIGHDWLVVAAIAFAGKIVTLDGPYIHQQRGGTSESTHRIASTSGLSRFQAEHTHVAIAAFAAADIVWGAPVFRSLGLGRRIALAAACWPTLLRRWFWIWYGVLLRQPRVRRSATIRTARGLLARGRAARARRSSRS